MQDNSQNPPKNFAMLEGEFGNRENALRHEENVRRMSAIDKERIAFAIGEDFIEDKPKGLQKEL